MTGQYLGAICGKEGNYGIVFLDFPGCVSAGDTKDEVLAMGEEALTGHIAAMVRGGDEIPEPSDHSIEDVIDWLSDPDDPVDEEWHGLHRISVDIPQYSETVSIPIRTDLVREISRANNGVNARTFIEGAARRELERIKAA